MIKLKRAYEKPAKDDGERILVERLWPRGLTKEQAKLDLWLKEIAPSAELRKWFGHDPDRWVEFRRRYLKELGQKADLVKLKYFAGLTLEQAAEMLGVSHATAERYWSYARVWLFREIQKST